MIKKGTYKLIYLLNKEKFETIIETEIRQIEGLPALRQAIYYGTVNLNGIEYRGNFEGCVNGKFLAQEIGLKIKKEIIEKAKIEGKNFKLKKEELL